MCLEGYRGASRERHPVSYAACGHSACRGCTASLAAPDGTIRCPVCRGVTTLAPGAAVETMPRNFAVACEDDAGHAPRPKKIVVHRLAICILGLSIAAAVMGLRPWATGPGDLLGELAETRAGCAAGITTAELTQDRVTANATEGPGECERFCARRAWTGTDAARVGAVAALLAGAAMLACVRPIVGLASAAVVYGCEPKCCDDDFYVPVLSFNSIVFAGVAGTGAAFVAIERSLAPCLC
jgi:hypothetical protein